SITGSDAALYAGFNSTAAVDGGAGDDYISIIGAIKSGDGDAVRIEGGDGNDTLGINYDNMDDIFLCKNNISGFENLILDMGDNDIKLDSLLDNLTEINSSGNNTLIINGDTGAGITLSDIALLQAATADPTMVGYDVYSYTNTITSAEVYVYIEQEISKNF
ncbi:MAG: hypothetical protein LBB52_04130, partial [Desulfovibrio sp.]|nr:hypothetical protein [Desulfovibrio sp.]